VGAGKSTVAKELVNLIPGPVANIEGDKFWAFIAKGAIVQSEGVNFKMIMRAMTAAATHYALNGYQVILDFSIPPWFLDTVNTVTKFKKVPLAYVLLKPDEAVCAARAAARAEGAIEDYGFYHDFYVAFDKAEQYTIHNNVEDAATTAFLIQSGLNDGRFHVE
jgi:hypothetical protein